MLDNIKKMASLFEELGMRVGADHTICPSGKHKNKTASCKVGEDGAILWFCHRCNIGGTIVDAHAIHYDISTKEVISRLTETYGDTPYAPSPPVKKVDKPNEGPIEPSSLNPPPPDVKFRIKSEGGDFYLSTQEASMFHMAPHKIGGKNIVSAVARWDIEGSKVIRQLHFVDGEWHKTKNKTSNQPIYKMSEIASASADTVIIVVEGEKCMDALQEAADFATNTYTTIPKIIVTTNLGGSGNGDSSGYYVVGDRRCLIIPDKDAPGKKWAQQVGKLLPHASILDPYQGDEADGFDIADWLEEGNDMRLLLKAQGEAPEGTLLSQAKHITRERIEGFLAKMVEAELSAIQEDEILDALKVSTGINMTTLRKAIKEIEGQNDVDWPSKIAQIVTKERFNDSVLCTSKIFFVYTGTHWMQAEDEYIKGEILKTIGRHLPAGIDIETTMRKAFEIMRAKNSTISSPLLHAQRPLPIINTLSGEIHIDPTTGTYEIKEHSPDSWLQHCLDIELDPSATCPEYDKTLEEIFSGDQDLIRHFHEITGYIIQPHRPFKNFFIGHGSKGNNGKSSLLHTVAQLCGPACSFARMTEFGTSKHDTSVLLGKLLQLDDDLDRGTKLSDGLIKQLSEGKSLNVEYKYKGAFQAYLYAAVVMLCNHWPVTTDLTKAMLHRAMVLPFRREFSQSEIDRHLFTRIRENELQGILNHALSGVCRLFARGAWDEPQACKDAKDEWLKTTSTLYDFIHESLELREGARVYSRDLREAYEAWCTEEGVQKQFWVQTRRLKQELIDLDLPVVNRFKPELGKWCVEGYGLKKVTDPLLDWFDVHVTRERPEDGSSRGTMLHVLFEAYTSDTGDDITPRGFANRMRDMGLELVKNSTRDEYRNVITVNAWLVQH